MTTESKNQSEGMVRIVKSPIRTSIQAENSNRVTGEYTGVAIEVQLGETVVWERDIYPIIMPLRQILLIDVKNPFYARQIASAEKKAAKVVKAISNTTVRP